MKEEIACSISIFAFCGALLANTSFGRMREFAPTRAVSGQWVVPFGFSEIDSLLYNTARALMHIMVVLILLQGALL